MVIGGKVDGNVPLPLIEPANGFVVEDLVRVRCQLDQGGQLIGCDNCKKCLRIRSSQRLQCRNFQTDVTEAALGNDKNRRWLLAKVGFEARLYCQTEPDFAKAKIDGLN